MNRSMSAIAQVLFFLLAISILCIRCANPMAPTGGPKDSLPPALVSVYPKDSSENFNNKKVVFTFSEFLQLDNIHDNLIVSPLPKREPQVDSKLRTITINIKDTLEPNTTYTYNFGNAVKDINEGNILKNFTYVFSTGPYIDSLQMTGRVLLAEKGVPDTTLIVLLHRNADDSAVIKERPRYIARLDSAGNFHFRHLPPGTFYLYALKDEGGQKKYQSKQQLFAFADKAVTVGRQNSPLTLYAYSEKEEKVVGKPAPAKPTITKQDKNREQDKRLKFTLNLDNGQQDLLSNLEFVFAEPLKNFDSSKARLTDEQFKTIAGYSFTEDTSHKKLVLSYKWPEDKTFNLVVDRDFAEDSAGRKIARTDTLQFKTKKESDYGSLSIRFNNLDLAKKPVLQLLQNDVVLFSRRLTNRDFKEKLFKPGEYEIRVLFDDNNNGVWDPGEFFGKHLQPEKVIAVKRKLIIKANWDNDNTIDL